jgi:hypothetical protein
MPLNCTEVLLVLRVDVREVVGAHRTVRRLHRQLAHTGEEAVNLLRAAVRRLEHRDAVVRVALGDRVAADLGVHRLRDTETRGVIRSAVDAAAAGEASEARLQSIGGLRHLVLRVHRGDVGVDAESHGSFFLLSFLEGS